MTLFSDETRNTPTNELCFQQHLMAVRYEQSQIRGTAMSMMHRLVRAFDTMANVELDDQERGGMLGEQYAEYIIDDGPNGCYIRNPIIPHPTKRGLYLETDFLVYVRGTLYCVEIKNFRGRVYYPAHSHMIYVEKGWFIFKRLVPQMVFDGYDYSKMIQEKMGHYREGMIRREMPNPFLKTRRFIDDLKRYLYLIDPRLRDLPIYPVLGFSEKADISAIYNFDAGILYISQLPTFFEKYSNPAFAQSPAPWIQQALHRLPTWDRIATTQNEWIHGVIPESNLRFTGTDGRRYNFPYARIHSVDMQRAGVFSAYDDVTITYIDGSKRSFQSVDGEIHLKRFKGEQQVHTFRNVGKVIVGIANKG